MSSAVPLPTLAVVVPTYNERDNIMPLLDSLERGLSGLNYEVIVVDDDSPDGTAKHAWSMVPQYPNLKVLHRINRQGLSSACIEGMMASRAPYVAVIDGDMQHDESILPKMLAKIQAEGLDVVVGSRYVEGGGMGELSPLRVWLSNMGRSLSRAVCRVDLNDPMSGFFVLDRRFLMEVVRSLSATGFKILLDILATSRRPVRVGEVGYTFRNRKFGESKLDVLVSIEYAQLLVDKVLCGVVPSSYLFFCAVGGLGFGFHLVIVRWLTVNFGVAFVNAQWFAAFAVMTANFLLNNQLTFRSHRLRGWKVMKGFAVFCGACALGLYMNVAVAESAARAGAWWLWASVAGLAVGSVWNYGVTSVFVWNIARRRRMRMEEAGNVRGTAVSQARTSVS